MLNEDDYHKDKNFKPIPQQYFCKLVEKNFYLKRILILKKNKKLF